VGGVPARTTIVSKLKLSDVEKGKVLWTKEGDLGQFAFVAFSPDGEWVAGCDAVAVRVSSQGSKKGQGNSPPDLSLTRALADAGNQRASVSLKSAWSLLTCNGHNLVMPQVARRYRAGCPVANRQGALQCGSASCTACSSEQFPRRPIWRRRSSFRCDVNRSTLTSCTPLPSSPTRTATAT
jgi:hypothetical protein